jgi:hypothetical protein
VVHAFDGSRGRHLRGQHAAYLARPRAQAASYRASRSAMIRISRPSWRMLSVSI